MTPDEIKVALELHRKWLAGDPAGVRLVWYGKYLRLADLSSANLCSADLRSADLSLANLSLANLRSADLRLADLSLANLRSADLSSADLRSADLSSADLSSADLRLADLSLANLSLANLCSADLSSVKNADLAKAMTEILPREGEVIGWKKCRNNILVKLRVPPDAKRSNATGRKCRAERVEVLEVVGSDTGVSLYDEKTKYRVGETVKSSHWGEDRFQECDGGIHFLLTREEAEAFKL